MAGSEFVGSSAVDIAERVRAGKASPRDVVQAHLEQIERLNDRLGAFVLLRAERALAEADDLAGRDDLADLPLAGVPVAIKDNVDVAGEPTRDGSEATPEEPRPRDHEVVRRLREAGAVVVGKTALPELGVWAATDGAWGVTRNPWDAARTPGGSSGGSAAAVAAGMVPLAHGNDGLGSIRIPAACCGLFGIKPGAGVVPSDIGASNWFGMVENGPLATTVGDAALALSVMADRPELREVAPPEGPLRVAVSTRTPLRGTRLDREYRRAATEMVEALAGIGHWVEEDDPPYSTRFALKVLGRWFAGAAEDAQGVPASGLQRRTRGHVRMGRAVLRLRRPSDDDRREFRRRVAGFFQQYDIVVTPALANPPIAAKPWSERGWFANLWANANYAPYAASWNLAGYPAASVPAGRHSAGVPLAVQLVAPYGGEATVLSIAGLLEGLRPWARHAPMAGL